MIARTLLILAALAVLYAGYEVWQRQRGYAKARESALAPLKRGQRLGGGEPRSRDELHDRAKLR